MMVTTLPQRSARQAYRLKIAFALAGVYLVAEVVASFMTGSLALLADASHMLTDVVGVGLALFAITLAQRPATPARTYGYYRAEILAVLANTALLLATSGYVLVEAYRRLIAPPVVDSGPMLIVAVVGLAVNIAAIVVLRAGSSESLNVRGAYLEVVSDALSSIGVIAGAAVMWTTGWYYADPIVSAGIGLFILPRTWRLMREATGILLEGTPSDISLGAVREALGKVDGVIGVHDLHVWSLTSGLDALSAHVVRHVDASHDDVLGRVHDAITGGFPIAHVTIQLEQPGWERRETHL